MGHSADADHLALGHPRHLRGLRGGRSRVRDRVVTPARARVRQHDPGRVGHPGRLLRRDGDRQRGRRPAGGPGALAAAAVRPDRAGARRRRPRDPVDVRGHPVAVRRGGRGSRGRAAGPRRAPTGPCAAGPGAGDRADGRHAADADALSQRRCAPERVVRAAVRGEHDRRDPGHVRGGAGPDRGARARGRAAGGCDRLGVRRDHGTDPVAGARCPGRRRRCRGSVAVGRRRRLRPAHRRSGGARPDGGVHVRADVARLPGAVDPAAGLGDRQHDVRVHGDPGRLPDRPRPRRAGVQPGPFAHRRPGAVPGRGPDRGRGAGDGRAGRRPRPAREPRPRQAAGDPPGAAGVDRSSSCCR